MEWITGLTIVSHQEPRIRLQVRRPTVELRLRRRPTKTLTTSRTGGNSGAQPNEMAFSGGPAGLHHLLLLEIMPAGPSTETAC
jgi:hypothetical protein